MHVSHPEKTTCHNQSTLLAQYNFQLEVHEIELSEEVKKKERKVPTAALLRTLVRSSDPFAPHLLRCESHASLPWHLGRRSSQSSPMFLEKA